MTSLLQLLQTTLKHWGKGGEVIYAVLQEHPDSSSSSFKIFDNGPLSLVKSLPLLLPFVTACKKKKKKSMLTFLLKLLFNSGGPRIIANFLQGICSLKCTVWNFSFSLLFFFIIFYLRLVLSLLRTCKCVAFECCKVNAENDSLNGIIKADVSII